MCSYEKRQHCRKPAGTKFKVGGTLLEGKEHSKLILKLLEKPTTIATLMNQTGFNEELTMNSLDYLQEEEKIEILKEWITAR